MKKFLLASTALLTVTAGAFAADLPVRAAPPAPVYAAPIFTWSGLYVGVNAGFASNRSKSNWVDMGQAPFGCWNACTDSYSATQHGVIGGAQIGYNFQAGNFVYGVEADLAAVSGDGKARPDSDETYKTALSAFGTVRARAGMAFDRALVYVTGGLAYGKVRNAYFNYDCTVGPGCTDIDVAFSQNKWRAGWTVGAGLEYAINHNWTVKAEGLYYDLGKKTVTAVDTDGYLEGMKFKNDGFVARIGLNYKFGAPTPVVAKY